MNEASARQVLLLRAIETAAGDSPHWSAQDSAWASRAALESVGPQAAPERFIAERAHHAMQRLAPRDTAVAATLARRLWRPSWWLAALVLGLGAGLAADAIGSGQRINLLAPPVWGVVGWNLVVYGLLLWGALQAGFASSRAAPGWLTAGLQRLLGRGQSVANRSSLQAFAIEWARCGATLGAARAGGLLHAAAAALGAGLVAGLYLRGLVLDYRAGWESTFLDAGQVHAALEVLLAPALGVSGIELPGAAALEALRFAPGQPVAGAAGAVWIHLFALTLALVVVLPRTALALSSGLRARALARRFPLPLNDGYFQRLLRHQHGAAARVQVLPYAQAVGPQAELALRAVFGRFCGETAQLHVAPPVAFGAEDEDAGAARVPPGTTLVVACFDLTATPEAENQGRFVQRLAAAAVSEPPAPVLMLIDEAAFVRRFGSPSDRLTQRRAAWRALATTLGTVPVFVDLAAPDLAATEQALQMALGAPAQVVAAASSRP